MWWPKVLFVYFKGIQHFGDSVLNPNKKTKDFEELEATSSTATTAGIQQQMAVGLQDNLPTPSSVSPNISRSGSSHTMQQDYMATKISDSSSCTQVLLLWNDLM